MPKIKDSVTDNKIHHGRREKLRDSFQKYGLHTFNETQVLEFALGMVVPRLDTNPTAHRLMDMFGSLDGVINSHPDKLKLVPGVGEQTAYFLSFLKEFVTYYMAVSKSDEKIKTPADASRNLREVMKTFSCENFVMLCLDKSGAVLNKQTIKGSIDKVDINLRDITDTLFRVNSASVVLAHNHLDGLVTPSDADLHLTRTLINILAPLGVNVLDHIIFAGDNEYSFARSGVLDVFKREHKAFRYSKDYEDILEEEFLKRSGAAGAK